MFAPPASPFRIVITDIDGTLLDDEGNLPELNRQAMLHCQNVGVRICLATGRRWTTCLRLLDRLNLHDLVDFCIINNGMIIQDIRKNKLIARRDFPFPLLLQVMEKLNSLSLDPIALGHSADGKTPDVFHRHDCLKNHDFISKNAAHAHQVSDWDELKNRHVVELVLIGTEEELTVIAKAVASLEIETAILRNSFYFGYMLEITPKGVSKLLGAQDLLGHLGLISHQAIAVGDSNNDYTLLKDFPFSVAVANADSKILSIVKEVTGSNNEGGFGQSVFKHIPRIENAEKHTPC